ncbi:MAG TPA: Obg family GTPase CgtA, partial [Patescibacteria group bacterium]|nr:Obg family GTPase CgtA [Patescibacteria group bacterium]
ELRQAVPNRTPIVAISAASKDGVPSLLRKLKSLVSKQRQVKTVKSDEGIPVLRLPDQGDAWQITQRADEFIITGQRIERFAARTDFSSEAGVQRLRDIMRKMGIMHELTRKGAKPGQKIAIGGVEGPKVEY